MKTCRVLSAVALVALLMLLPCDSVAEDASGLFQKGLTAETAEGDLEKAIGIYQKIVQDHGGQPSVAAKAQLHIGLCYEKLGRERAKDAYRAVIERFPGQTEAVRQAQERLRSLEEAEQIKQPQVGAGPEKTRAMMDELARSRKRIKAFRASMKIAMDMMGSPVVMEGKIQFKRPEKFRQEMLAPGPAGQSTTVFDGEVSWTLQPQTGLIVRIGAKRIRDQYPDFEVSNFVFRPFHGLDPESLRYIGSASHNGEDTFVFQGNATEMISQMGFGQMRPAWVEVWVGKADGLTRGMLMYRETGKEMMSLEATIEALNPAIPDSTFVVTVPEGAQVTDLTDMSLKMWGDAKEKARTKAEGGGTEGGEAVMKELKDRRKGLHSYRAKVTRQMQMMGTSMTISSEEWMSQDRMRQEVTQSMGPGKTIVVKDSLMTWTYIAQMNMVQKVDHARMKQAMKEIPKEPGKKKRKSFFGIDKETVKYLGRQSLDDQDVHFFEGKVLEPPMGLKQFKMDRCEVWVGADDGLVRKMVMYNDKGEEAMSETRTDVEINLDLPDSLFVFTPPENAQVMDLTENTIKMVRKMSGSE